MNIKNTLKCVVLLLAMSLAALAQNAGQLAQNMLPGLLQMVQMRAEMTGQMYAFAQQMGNQAEMQRCQMEAQMHQMMYNGVAQLAQNPAQLNDPQVQQQFLAVCNEYNYRSETRDMRPYQQIQGDLARYVQYASWKAGTPQGQAAHQAGIQGIQSNTAQMTANHNARMNGMYAQEGARNQNWSQSQAISDNRQQQFVHGIYNEYQYVNPNTNQGYWVPMEIANPAVRNNDGTYTELTPYHNY